MKVWVGLGANLGDARAALAAACAALDGLPGTRLVRRSSLWRSAPVDAAGPDFHNAVAELDTTLAPAGLLAALHAIEAAHGRERPYRNAPRTLDLDLLFYGDEVIDTASLVVPHPRAHLRAFVLRPLLELEPGFEHPRLGPLVRWSAAAADQAIERLD
ncbi:MULTISPECIES: 2-amino-4-hydroxy-6-hydroxymethyldihydropteridine diphosphokinase [unclassified Rubrivivax]|uniref:2-amino-4-hydroxy-6- hydroxymethyldihydropteridine diphosphokinase n=1 Tax=unclassified Rubrivivax TaxID=2649762 RepID=UPI001E41BCFC|nr:MULTISPECIES: 2-amino-4-hydroxy-6-hydroxymethyldihydropteridine diphosphokinase [unclassified Rubrivivax]MCC9595827.1 2-amino-4-hydroxy-6-hydroxymethyldihydropteridine diphosphokinase [Rubrivivax sp. JA1055]MCC9647833.1 2-amino-4-hydroxy-6-hydroxymethyldihydropteridine diphosphokinase [Rubrivivax sp. JA1029]